MYVNKLLKIISGFLFVCLFCFANLSLAHTSGASIELEVDEYLLDIGYNPVIVSDGTQTRFDFDIKSIEDTDETVTFDDIWVRLEKDGRVFYAGGLSKQRFGNTGLTYTFVESGLYQIFVRFSNEGESLAETTFDFPVEQTITKEPFFDLPIMQKVLLLAVGIVIGVAVSWFALKKKNYNV